MRYRVIITVEALHRIDSHLDYIAIEKQDPLGAERWWKKALRRVESLYHFPHRCPCAPENDSRDYLIRMLTVDRCLFLYTVDDAYKVVRVFGFRHGSQEPRLDELPKDDPSGK